MTGDIGRMVGSRGAYTRSERRPSQRIVTVVLLCHLLPLVLVCKLKQLEVWCSSRLLWENVIVVLLLADLQPVVRLDRTLALHTLGHLLRHLLHKAGHRFRRQHTIQAQLKRLPSVKQQHRLLLFASAATEQGYRQLFCNEKQCDCMHATVVAASAAGHPRPAMRTPLHPERSHASSCTRAKTQRALRLHERLVPLRPPPKLLCPPRRRTAAGLPQSEHS
eukprot:359219-Chlamydomonas_euryale.AAC.5